MSSEISTNKILLTSKTIDSKWLVISNLPRTATEETIRKYFQRYGRVQSIRIDDQRFAFIRFFDRHAALKAHNSDNILDRQQLRTAFHDGSNSVPKILLQTSSIASSIIQSSSPSHMTTITKTIIQNDRDKYTLHNTCSPEENTRYQVVPIKDDVDFSQSKRKTSLDNNSKPITMKSSSSSESERSHHHNLSSKYPTSNLKKFKTKILKIYHLPSKLSSQILREKLRNIFLDFKKSSHLLTIKIIDDYALLTFQKYEDVDKALLFIITKSMNGVRLKAEPYNNFITDIDEYSIKATRTLYIGNLQSEISHNELRELYSEYGDIIDIEIKRQQSSNSQIFAFIQYTDIKSVVKAMESKIIRDHSIKLGFGKSQPTNVLWLGNLPSNITESDLRLFLNRITNLSSNEILDIYIDNRNCPKNQIIQCLVYFIDIITAQNSINLIRGKKIQSKRIQVDFASKILVTTFSDIIEETNNKKNNDRRTSRSHQSDRHSKASDIGSSLNLSNIISPSVNQSRHYSSSSLEHDSINQKKLIKSDSDKDANHERIFDWLMQNQHLNINDNDQEKSIDKCSIETKKEIHSKDEIFNNNNDINSHDLPKNNFQPKIIPLESNPLFIQLDIRLKVYTSLSNQSITSLYLPFPQFARALMKSSNIPIILNPKAHTKHLSNINKTNEDLLIQNQFDERLKLLDKQIYENNRKILITNTTLNTQQTSPSYSSESSLTIISSKKYNPMPSTSTLLQSIPSSLISPPLSSSTNRLSPPLSNEKSSTKLLERLGPLAKFKHKSIPPPLSVITTFPVASSTSNSPMFPTPNSIVGHQIHSPTPTPLKSILKQPSKSLDSTVKQNTSSDDKKKSINQQQTNEKKPLNQSISLNNTTKASLGKIPKKANAKSIETVVQSPKLIKETPRLPIDNSQTIIKNVRSTSLPLINHSNKIQKMNIAEANKRSSLTIQQKKPLLTTKQVSTNKSLLTKIDQKLITKSNHNNIIKKKSGNKIFKLKQNTCMYDRIKKRARNEQIQHSLLPKKDKSASDEHNDDIIQAKNTNKIIDSSDSKKDLLMKTTNKQTIVFDSNIFDTEENEDKKTNKIINRQTIKMSKSNNEKLRSINKSTNPRKHSLTHESNESSKKIKLEPITISSINEEQMNKTENLTNDTISNKINTTSESVDLTKDLTLNIDIIQPTLDAEPISDIVVSTTNTISQDIFNKEEISNVASSQIPADESTSHSVGTSSNKDSQEPITYNEPSISTSLNETIETSSNVNNQVIVTDQSIPVSLSPNTKLPPPPSSTLNETLSQFDIYSLPNPIHSSTSIDLFPQMPTPDSNLFTSSHQHFPYPLFIPSPLSNSPLLSTRRLSSNSCNSVIENPLFNKILSEQQHCYDKELKSDSIRRLSTISPLPPNHSTLNNIINQHQYLGSDSIVSYRNSSEFYNYTGTTQQMLNSFYHVNDIQSFDLYDIQWEGYVILKTDQAYIKTQLIVGNPQIARISINYWNSDLNHNLRISQRMRLEEIQLDGVQKHMQMDNDYCILIAEPNGLTPEEIRLEQNHLKNGVIQYLNEKQAAGIINIILPGVLQPVYVVHIFPPCQFASEILQKRAPDAYRCVVQNRIEQIYLVFIITTTAQ
ncbi:unnamed protein product [Adineta steineri]|uniref:Msx2-interacting protein n=1 Tax=Adineta steineri TaxID=433720 RepID=A0A813PE91_9BILA|nr:unnamed protein product [Adineta steineri]CAF1506580.1 unnamed protein product [Adineta steineri]